MKLSKEEIKKIVLSAVVIVILLICYKYLMLDSLVKKAERGNATISDLTPKIKAAKDQIKLTEEIEKKAPVENEVLEQIKALIPAGEPLAWFSPRMADFFKRQGIEKCTTRLSNVLPEKELPGFKKMAWSITLPKTDFIQLAIAIAGLENEEPLLEITSLRITASKDDYQSQQADLTVSTIVKDEKR